MRRSVAFIVVFALQIQSAIHAFAITVRTVALTSTAAPGGGIYTQFETPTINTEGEVAFTGAVKSANKDVYGIWSEASGSLQPIVKVLDPAPGTGGLHGGFFSAVVTDNSQTLFMSSIAGVSPHINTLWYTEDGTVKLSAPPEIGAPGVPGAYLQSMQNPVFNAQGNVAFESSLIGPGINYLNNRGIWTGPVESPELAVRTGDDVAGVDEGEFQLLSRPKLNNLGHFAFEASFGPSDTVTRSGIFVKRNDPAELLVSTETEAPGTNGAIFGSRMGRNLDLNDNGEVAFSGYLDGNGITNANRDGIWLFRKGMISLIVRSGDTAPHTDGAIFGQHGSTVAFGSPIINNAGQVLFNASLTGSEVDHLNSDSIWLHENGKLSQIVRAGQTASGTSRNNFWGLLRPLLNNAGQIVFGATLTPQPDEYFGRHGVWLTDRSGILKLIIQEGALFDVNDDPNITDLRTIETVLYNADEDSGISSFNDSGQLAFRVVFTDGTQGIFVANMTIPEPSTVLIAAITILLQFRTPRHGRHHTR